MWGHGCVGVSKSAMLFSKNISHISETIKKYYLCSVKKLNYENGKTQNYRAKR